MTRNCADRHALKHRALLRFRRNRSHRRSAGCKRRCPQPPSFEARKSSHLRMTVLGFLSTAPKFRVVLVSTTTEALPWGAALLAGLEGWATSAVPWGHPSRRARKGAHLRMTALLTII